MLPRRQHDPLERPEAEIVVRPEVEEGPRIAMLGDQFDPRLHRDHDDHPEGERDQQPRGARAQEGRSEEHTSELQSLMRISYAVFCLKKKKNNTQNQEQNKTNHRYKT